MQVEHEMYEQLTIYFMQEKAKSLIHDCFSFLYELLLNSILPLIDQYWKKLFNDIYLSITLVLQRILIIYEH